MVENRKRKGANPFMGKTDLFWCSSCQVFQFEGPICNKCTNKLMKMTVTPPGDIRPAFEGERRLLKQIINRDFGEGMGEALFPEEKIILVNKIGALDVKYEVFVDGYNIGVISYDIPTCVYKFKMKPYGGHFLYFYSKKLGITLRKHIVISKEAEIHILNHSSVLIPSIQSYSSDIEVGDYVILLNSTKDKVIGSGIARIDSKKIEELLIEGKGIVAKNKYNMKYYSDIIDPVDPQVAKTLKDAYQHNYTFIQEQINEAMEFIKNTKARFNKPCACAFSGGKDSLTVFLLMYKVFGPDFKIFFADTGLELPEVHESFEKLLDLVGMRDKTIIKHAGDTFWNLVKTFGPPARDFRYCCHSLKAQQIMDMIQEIANVDKLLVFLGQRRYESFTRMTDPRIYVNSYIPLQIAASPIKHWNALLLWMVLLNEKIKDKNGDLVHVPINPLYFQGHERIGCFLCPATSIAGFQRLKETHPDLHKKWFDFLENYRKEHGYPEEWLKLALWRNKKYPPQWRNIINRLGIQLQTKLENSAQNLKYNETKGFSPCVQGGYSIKGRFNSPINLEGMQNFLDALTDDYEYDDLGILTIILNDRVNGEKVRKEINLFSDGSVLFLFNQENVDYERLKKEIFCLVLKASFCNLCGTCAKVCTQKAIKIKENQAEDLNNEDDQYEFYKIDNKKCTHCKTCIYHCPLFVIAKNMEIA